MVICKESCQEIEARSIPAFDPEKQPRAEHCRVGALFFIRESAGALLHGNGARGQENTTIQDPALCLYRYLDLPSALSSVASVSTNQNFT